MTIFRDDIGVWFFAMFLCLLGGKVWQWIGEGRVEFLEQQPPANPRLFHARLSTSLVLSVLFDAFMVRYCLRTILQDARPGMMVMFGFEYVLLFIVSASTLGRYALSIVELAIIHRQTQARAAARLIAREQARQAAEGDAAQPTADEEDDDDDDVPGWEEKGRWVFYLDLFTGMLFPRLLQLLSKQPRRFYQIRRLPWILLNPHRLPWNPHPHHAGPLYDLPLIDQTRQRLPTVPKCNPRHERTLSRCNSRRVGPGKHLHRLS